MSVLSFITARSGKKIEETSVIYLGKIPPRTRSICTIAGGWRILVAGRPQTTQAFLSYTDQARISDVIQDSDFRTEIGSRKNMRLSAFLRASGALSGDFASSD